MFKRLTKQEIKGFTTVNDEKLTTIYAILERLVSNYGIDTHRFYNLIKTKGAGGRSTNSVINA